MSIWAQNNLGLKLSRLDYLLYAWFKSIWTASQVLFCQVHASSPVWRHLARHGRDRHQAAARCEVLKRFLDLFSSCEMFLLLTIICVKFNKHFTVLFVQCFWKLVGKVIMVSLHFIFAFVCCFRNFVSVELASKNHLAAGAIKFQVRKTGNK